jgi:hypothetical protein
MGDSGTTPAVFLSHTSAEKPFARTLAAELQKNGISCWVDEAEIHYGESLVQKISDAIEHIALVLAVISRNSAGGAYIARCAMCAKALGTKVAQRVAQSLASQRLCGTESLPKNWAPGDGEDAAATTHKPPA